MSATPVDILRRSDAKFVKAQLLAVLEPIDLELVERAWAPARERLLQALLAEGVPRSDWPESLHWDWGKKAADPQLLATTGFGIVHANEWQGAVMTKTVSNRARLPDGAGRPLVYVDYIEVAPWNWNVDALAQRGRYKLVGTALMRGAVAQSRDEGFHGRVGLHARRAELLPRRMRNDSGWA